MLLELLAVKEINKPPEIPQPKPTTTIKVEKKKETKPKKIYYTIKKNDTLTKVSKRFKVPVSRVICANKQLDNPDLIRPSERLRIPHKKDKLKCAKIKKQIPATVRLSKPLVNSRGFSSSENLYEYHSCTWWVKEWKPSVGNWGNANQWGYNSGLGIHSIPIVGSIAWSARGGYGHVALVVGVSGDNVTIKEGNFDYAGSVRTTSVPTSSYQYLY